MKNSPHSSRSGFTLVELLVVIGIIALLISILLPALSRARVAALKVQCLSQFRQLGNAILMYTNEAKGSLPGPCSYGQKAYYGNETSPINRSIYLSTFLAPYLHLPIADSSTTGQLNRYFVCPAFPYNAQLADNYDLMIQQKYIPISMSTSPNASSGPYPLYPFGYQGSPATNPPPQYPMRITQLEQSQSVVLLREIDQLNTHTNTSTGQYLASTSWSTGWTMIALPLHGLTGPASSTNTVRHLSTRNKLFADGHAASVQENP